MDFRVFSRNISENMHARCVREDTKQALKGNLQADGVQSRQTLFVRYCRRQTPMNTSSYSAESILRSCLQTAEKQDGLPCKNIVFSNSSRIRRKRKFYYIIFFGVCVGGFKNFFGFLEIWCEMLGLEGKNEWNRTRRAVSVGFMSRHIPLETFHRNVSKISAL